MLVIIVHIGWDSTYKFINGKKNSFSYECRLYYSNLQKIVIFNVCRIGIVSGIHSTLVNQATKNKK